ncbi:hypothetical protein [Lactobacillus selangorensis]|nr:hypothetical protein [Lactobacillus selangorensis]
MNHAIFAQIVRAVIRQRYHNLENFCQTHPEWTMDELLQKVPVDWHATPAQQQSVRRLFTDYEWMLVHKVIQRAKTLPEEEMRGAAIYQQAKALIAQTWLTAPYCKAQFQQDTAQIYLRLSCSYAEWGLDDQLDFVVPAQIKRAIETHQLDLLTWAKQLND